MYNETPYGKVFAEEEEAQTSSRPDAINKKFLVPDEEEEEAGMIAPASTY